MNTSPKPVITLCLPGWGGSGQGHWQTQWEALYGAQRVQQADWEQPLRGDWLAGLEEHMLAVAAHHKSPPRFALAAHSLGCHLVSAWAQHSRHAHWVVAALLVAPPDLTRSDTPPAVARWHPPVTKPLPFNTQVWGSNNDPFASWASTQALAEQWSATSQCINGAGHINAQSGLGDWAQGWQCLQALANNTTEHKGTPHHGH